MSDAQVKAMNLAVAIEQLDAAGDTLRAAMREVSNATSHLEDSNGYECYQIEKALEVAKYLLDNHVNKLIVENKEPF